jgi:SAM-dependent methyltransferase
MKLNKLKAPEKKIQMNAKYFKGGLPHFERNLFASKDLQGWRNLLVDKASKYANNKTTLDLGCGYGEKTYRMLIKSNFSTKKSYLVDFSSSALKVFSKNYMKENITLINDDAISGLKKIKDKEIDIVFLFGFVHELEDRKKLINLLKNKLSEDSLVLFSDNKLYFTTRDIFNDLNKLLLPGITFKKVLSLGIFHIYKSRTCPNEKFNYAFFWHKGRMDEVFGIFGKNHKKFFKLNLFGCMS